jgi:hypothetical protein
VDATGREVDRTPKTIANYRARYRRLAEAIGVPADNCAGVVAWFEAGDGEWAAPTIRQYGGAILQAIDDCSDMTAADRAQLVEPSADVTLPTMAWPASRTWSICCPSSRHEPPWPASFAASGYVWAL